MTEIPGHYRPCRAVGSVFCRCRTLLAEQAASAILGANDTAALRGQLRLVFLAEQLCAERPRLALELNAELDAVCRAVLASARRRPGWLYFAPAPVGMPVLTTPGLVQAALLCFVQGLLAAPTPQGAVVRLVQSGDAVRLYLRGGRTAAMPADLPPLLRRLAALADGNCVVGGGGAFTAALRLPLNTARPCRPPTEPDLLLLDRYSPLYLCLGGCGWIAEREE